MSDAPSAVPGRILVYGVTGSGKTTIARRLSEASGIPWHHVDDLTWEPGWSEVPLEEQRRRISETCAGERWILDTAYGKWLDIPLGRAELIVGLDYPRWLSFGRLLKRSLARAWDKRPVCNGNVESWRNLFSRNSILLWHFKSFSHKRRRMREWQAPPLVLLQSPKEAERWLERVADAVGHR
jgi:adenylate kinase family enzyme